MLRTTLFSACWVVLASAATTGEVHAYGAAHVGYTHVGPSGVQHYGATAVSTPAGHASTAHYGATTAGGVHYGTTTTHGATYGGYHYGAYGTTTTSAGVYRRY